MFELRSVLNSRWLVIVFAALVAIAPLRAHADVLTGSESQCVEAHDLADDEAAHLGHGSHHAHGCGSCHFHAVQGHVAEAVWHADLSCHRMPISNQEIQDADASGQFRPPRI